MSLFVRSEPVVSFFFCLFVLTPPTVVQRVLHVLFIQSGHVRYMYVFLTEGNVF